MHATHGIVLASIGLLAVAGAADAKDYEAASTTAVGITGDMSLTDTAITYEDGTRLAFADKTKSKVVYNGDSVEATIFKLKTPANPTFKGSGNDLCGENVTYLAVIPDTGPGDPGVIVATFTGEQPPESVDDEMCSSYWYVEKK
ncbi:hypothetical protein [Mangrovibrevibacter kandeliae]|uniref:hypothetical protein n=1 Tax=Mangrovibrevibacter kandeliae TaxID=2968473 RepID=UPI002117AA8C|nr:hypothetical protein [Aurantimonas sp. CSK15Z-1]MCQ8782632.1 hypothetical protein [Aurantimonas sp. CSK15Z-1]